jgi:hypothetical protein
LTLAKLSPCILSNAHSALGKEAITVFLLQMRKLRLEGGEEMWGIEKLLETKNNLH